MLNIVTEKQEQAIKGKVSKVLLLMTPNKDFVSGLSFTLNGNDHNMILLE